MVTSFKFGRGLSNPHKDLLNYLLADIEFSRRMYKLQLGQRSISTVRPDGVANILMGTSSGLIPTHLSGYPHFVRSIR